MGADDALTFPEACLRGIASPKNLRPNGRLDTEAFVPYPKTAEGRTDGCQETSINWEDDEEAVSTLRKSGAHAQHGVARLPRRHIDNVMATVHELGYERAPLKNNKYHGNLLFGGGDKAVYRQIAGALAVAARLVPTQEVPTSETADGSVDSGAPDR